MVLLPVLRLNTGTPKMEYWYSYNDTRLYIPHSRHSSNKIYTDLHSRRCQINNDSLTVPLSFVGRKTQLPPYYDIITVAESRRSDGRSCVPASPPSTSLVQDGQRVLAKLSRKRYTLHLLSFISFKEGWEHPSRDKKCF
jgi:hypothetical protein